MKPIIHCKNSAKKFGGVPSEYEKFHNFFDQTKAFIPDQRHRAILHNAWGIFLLEQVFGSTFINSEGTIVSVRSIGEQHVIEDMGKIPTLQDCLGDIPNKYWFGGDIKPPNKIIIVD